MLGTITDLFYEALSALSHNSGNWFGDAPAFLIGFAIQSALWVLPGIALLLAAKLLIVNPARRHEAARAFLDLLEMGLMKGRSPENTVVEIAATGDKTLGRAFLRFAAHIQGGASLGRALALTPGVVPEPVVAMLQAGERLGDIRKVLPACRDTLSAGPSRAMGAFNYLPVFSPLLPLLAVTLFLCIVVIPKFHGIFDDLLEDGSLPVATRMVTTYAATFLEFGVLAVVLAFTLLLLGWARRRWPSAYSRTIKTLYDHWLFRLPWRHKRMQRDFSAMLAILLDSGVRRTGGRNPRGAEHGQSRVRDSLPNRNWRVAAGWKTHGGYPGD